MDIPDIYIKHMSTNKERAGNKTNKQKNKTGIIKRTLTPAWRKMKKWIISMCLINRDPLIKWLHQ